MFFEFYALTIFIVKRSRIKCKEAIDMNAYVKRVYDGLCARNAHEKEYLQAAEEMLTSLSPVFDKHPE